MNEVSFLFKKIKVLLDILYNFLKIPTFIKDKTSYYLKKRIFYKLDDKYQEFLLKLHLQRLLKYDKDKLDAEFLKILILLSDYKFINIEYYDVLSSRDVVTKKYDHGILPQIVDTYSTIMKTSIHEESKKLIENIYVQRYKNLIFRKKS